MPVVLQPLLVKVMHTVVIHEDVCGASVRFIVSDSGFKRLYCRFDDGVKAFLVDRTLNGSMRQWSVLDVEALHRTRRVVFRVCFQLADGAKELEQGVDDGMAKELLYARDKSAQMF